MASFNGARLPRRAHFDDFYAARALIVEMQLTASSLHGLAEGHAEGALRGDALHVKSERRAEDRMECSPRRALRRPVSASSPGIPAADVPYT